MDNQPTAIKIDNSFNLKKLVFAPIFLIFFAFFSFELAHILNIPNLALSMSISTLIQLIIFTLATMLASLFFVVFAALAFDWRVIAPISFLAALLVFIFLASTTGLIAAVAIFIILCSVYLMLERTLKSYLDFKPTTLFKPAIKNLTWLLIIISALVYFLIISSDIQKNGFQLPDSLFDLTLKFMPEQNLTGQLDTGSTTPQIPQIPKEQLDLLKQNPSLLKQYGLDAKMLDSLDSSKSNSSPTQSPIKTLIKDQLQTMLKPYQNFIAPVLAILFYFTLTFFTSIFSLFLSLFIWLMFLILEKTGFIKFTTEQRTVRKMVI